MMNSSGFRTGLVLVALVVSACGGRNDVADEAQPGDQRAADTGAAATQERAEPGAGRADAVDLEQLSGQVMVTGTAQMEFVTLQIDGGGSVNLSGELLPELRRLSGANVSVLGTRKPATPLEGFEAASYEVTSIDGQRPSVGILEERDGVFTLAGAETVRLTGVPDALRRQVGAKVGVTGRQTDSGLQVQSYGVIREP